MSARARTALVVLVSLGCSLLPSPGPTARLPRTITVNGKTTKLAHAYARAVKGFFDKTKEDFEVILSDVPLEAKALEDQFERIKLADAGKLHAFEITLNAEGKPISTAFRDNGFKKASPSGLSSADVFTKKVFDGKTVEGTYKSAKESEFFGETYSFDVAFKAPITRAVAPRSAPSAAETAAAQKSPQAKAVRRVPQGRPEGGPRGAQEARLLRMIRRAASTSRTRRTCSR